MASPVDVVGRDDTTLRSTSLLLEDIHDRAADWDERPLDERADFWLEWEAIVDRLHGVVEDDAAGGLTPEQRVRLRDLARRLVESRQVIQRMGLIYPDLGHLLATVPMSADERIAHDVTSLNHWAGLLRHMGDFWDTPVLDDGERRAFPFEWERVVTLFDRLATLAARGEMQPDARVRLRDVADYLIELLPTMQKLKLRQPDPEALARARSVEAA
jgi:hypothetical protein